MAKFTEAQWAEVTRLLDSDSERFGLPARRDGSVVVASFNIRKLGRVGNRSAGATPDGFDYRVFNFSELFAEALHGRPLAELTKPQKKGLFSRFEHDVSDHLPVWIRLPKP